MLLCPNPVVNISFAQCALLLLVEFSSYYATGRLDFSCLCFSSSGLVTLEWSQCCQVCYFLGKINVWWVADYWIFSKKFLGKICQIFVRD